MSASGQTSRGQVKRSRWTAGLLVLILSGCPSSDISVDGREEVVFWHFWGGEDGRVVDDIVLRFNASQSKYWVRSIAMPGNNLDLKLFLAVTGGDPPDLVNQDDPVIGDWAHRGTLMALDEIASATEFDEFRRWLLPAAFELGSFDQRLYGVANGLDVRLLYYNHDLLADHGLEPPETVADLDRLAETIGPKSPDDPADQFGFLPNPKLIWSWGIVFGGSFYDRRSSTVSLTHPGVVSAMEWMASYGERFGQSAIAFRAADQSLPGKVFPLTANRYAAMVGGQWRIRDIRAYQAAQRSRGDAVTEFGVTALPSSPDGPTEAGWINGNLFLVPRNSKNPRGAWEFMKFWIGFGGQEIEAARACIAGGWIPVSPQVVETNEFQRYLDEEPMMRKFVESSSSPNQRPRPNIRGAPLMDRELRAAAGMIMRRGGAPNIEEVLAEAERRVNQNAGLTDGAAP